MNTTENNKLIATFDDRVQDEFCGNKIFFIKQMPSLEGRYRHDFNFNEMRYHSSWEWLVPVVEKILLMNGSSGLVMTPDYLGGEMYEFSMLDDCKVPAQGSGKTMIEAVYNAVVQFVIWFNKQK